MFWVLRLWQGRMVRIRTLEHSAQVYMNVGLFELMEKLPRHTNIDQSWDDLHQVDKCSSSANRTYVFVDIFRPTPSHVTNKQTHQNIKKINIKHEVNPSYLDAWHCKYKQKKIYKKNENKWNYKITPYGYAQLSLMLNVIAMVDGILRY